MVRKSFFRVGRETVEGILVEMAVPVAWMVIAVIICIVLAWLFG